MITQMLNELVDQLHRGQRTPDSFRQALQEFDGHLAAHAEQAAELKPPAGYAEGDEMLAQAREGYQAFAEALALLRDYSLTRDPETAEAGLELAGQVQDLFAELEERAETNLDGLEARL